MLDLLCFVTGVLCGLFFMTRKGYFPWLKNQFEHSDEKIMFLVQLFKNRYCQPFQSIGFEGGMKAFLAGIKTEPYWENTEFNWTK